PQRAQLDSAQISLLARPLRRCQQSPCGHDISTRKFWFLFQQYCQCPVNFRTPFGETLAEFFGNALNLEIATRPIADLIAETLQFTSEFVVICVLGKLPCAQQLVIL